MVVTRRKDNEELEKVLKQIEQIESGNPLETSNQEERLEESEREINKGASSPKKHQLHEDTTDEGTCDDDEDRILLAKRPRFTTPTGSLDMSDNTSSNEELDPSLQELENFITNEIDGDNTETNDNDAYLTADSIGITDNATTQEDPSQSTTTENPSDSTASTTHTQNSIPTNSSEDSEDSEVEATEDESVIPHQVRDIAHLTVGDLLDDLSSTSSPAPIDRSRRRVSFNDRLDVVDPSRRIVSFDNTPDVVDPSRRVVGFEETPTVINPQHEIINLDDEPDTENQEFLVISSDDEDNHEDTDDEGIDPFNDSLDDIMIKSVGSKRQSIKEQLEKKPTNVSKLASAQCAICLDAPQVTVFLPCGHVFCNTCAFRSLSTTKQSTKVYGPCALCRNRTPYKKVVLGIFKKKKKFLGES